ncbi:MAG: hypothetical protein ACI808_001511 [Paraglaciecola sp.]|jgi:hypothetical protein
MFALGLAGCIATSQPEAINSIVIQNKTGSVLSDVSLKVPKTGGVVSCSSIPPNGECSLGFKERESQSNPVVISWIQNGKPYSQSLSANMIGHQTSELPLTVYLSILDYGVIQARME